jgi:hypothetical protein
MVLGAMFLWTANVMAQTTKPATTEVYHEAITDDVTLRIMRYDFANSELIGPLLPKRIAAVVTHGFQLSIEMHSRRGEKIVLASKALGESETFPTSIAVIFLERNPGQITLGLGVGIDLMLWRVQLDGYPNDTWCAVAGWAVQAAATQLDKRSVQVKTSRTHDGRLALTITDLRPDKIQPPTLMEQDGKEWQFKVVRRWDEPLKP